MALHSFAYVALCHSLQLHNASGGLHTWQEEKAELQEALCRLQEENIQLRGETGELRRRLVRALPGSEVHRVLSRVPGVPLHVCSCSGDV